MAANFDVDISTDVDNIVCSEENLRIFRTKFTTLMRTTFFQNPKKEPNYNVVVIRNCNGEGPWCFSDATINFTLPQSFPACMFFNSGFAEICKFRRECLKPVKEREQSNIAERTKKEHMVKKFINTVMIDSHEKCLQQLFQDKTLTKEKIKCILAIHYFKPLSKDGTYFVDKCDSCKSCPLCKETLKADMKESSFGHCSVWHGQADIVVQTSVVNIDVQVADDDANLSLEDDMDEESNEFDYSNFVEIKTEESKLRPKSVSKAIAQAIVNAFVEARKDKSLFNKFIPSFIATGQIIRIILFNCQLDKLLLSDELPIWKKDGTLSLRTLTCVWLTLNTFMNKLDSYAKYFIDRTPVSRFKDIVGESYDVYLNEVSRPLQKVRKVITEEPDSFEMEDWSIICDSKRELMKLIADEEEN